MKIKFTLLLLLCLLAGNFFSQAQPGFAPSCPTQSIYAHGGSVINGSSLPNGPPSTILSNLPAGAGGLAIGPAFGFPAPNPTWWTTNGGTYWYYDNTGNWTNTGHATTNFAAVNLGGGGTKLYNLVGGTGQVYVYSGTGPDVLLTTLVPPFGGGGPYDVQGDMADNFYILRGSTPQGIFCYNPQGVLTCSWSISGMIQQVAGGGFAILTTTNPAVQTFYYCSNGTNYIGNILPAQSNIVSTVQPLPPGADYASCALPVPIGFVTAPQGGSLTCNLNQIPLVAQVNGNASLGWTGGYLTPTSTPVTPTCGSITWAGPGIVNGQGTPTINVNAPGVYSYTVTGCNGCPSYTIVKSFTVVGQMGVLTPSITAPQCFAGPGTMSVSPNNNTNTVLWSGPGIVGANNTFTINFNQPGTYTAVVSTGSTCSGSATVIVNPSPTLVVNPNPANICFGGAVTLTASGAGVGGTYTWSPGALVTPTITVGPSVTTVYTVVGTNSVTCSGSVTSTVVVNPIPVITPTNTGPYCPGATIQLSVTAANTYSWTGPVGYTSNLQNPTIPNGQPLNSGIYSVTVTGVGGCVSSGTTNVTVNPAPTPTALANSPVCVNQTINLSGSGAAGYTWTGPNGYFSNLQNAVIAPAQATNAGVYTLNVISVNGCTNTATVNVVVNPLPVVIPGSNSPVCTGGNLSLTIGAFTSYSWTGPNAFTSNLQNPVITNAQAVNAGVYTVAVTNGSGCVNSGTVNVIVNPLPAISPTNTGPYCAGASINLSVSAATSYTWSGPGGFTSNVQNPVITNGQVVNSGIYTVVVTNGGGCVSTGTTNVVVNSLPTPTATSNSPVCQLQTINLNGSGGTTYTWTGPGGYLSNVQNPIIAPAQNTNAGTYTLGITNGNGCTNFTTVAVVVNPLPVIAVNNPLACLNQTINLTASGGTAYAWSGPLGYTSNVQNPVITNAQLNMSGGYTVVVTSPQGCTASAVANATVITLPQPTITSNSPLCAGATLSLTGGGGGTYSWSGPSGFTSGLQNPIISNVQLVNSGIYTLVVTAGTCTNSITSSITVNPLPTPTVSSSGTVCLLQPINLGAGGGTAYAWTGPNGYSANTASPVISVAQSTNAGAYTILVTGANGCNNTATTSVIVNPLPSPTTNSPVVCLNQPINLISGGGVSYSWTGPNGFASNIQNPVIANAQFSMSGLYTVVATSAQGCTNTAVASVTVLSLPQPSITSNIPCAGATLSFNGSGGVTYSWSGPAGFSSSLQNPSIGNVQMINGGTYTLMVTAGTCSTTATYAATINPLPVPTASVTNPVCVNQQASFTGGGGVNYIWTGPGGFNQPSQNAVIASAQFTNGGTYTLTVSDANSCVSYTTANLTVNLLPQINVNNPTACQNGVINLSAGGAASYTWSGPQGFASNSPNPGIPFVQPNQSGAYTVIGTSAQGCTNTAVANVQVIPSPSPVIVNNAPVCVNGMLSISASGGNSYQWYGPNNFSATATGTNFPNAQLNVAGVYTLIAAVGTCTGITTSNIIVNPLPTPTLSSNAPVCENSVLLLFGPGGYTYQWSGPNNFNGTGSNISIANAAMSNAGTFTAIATDPYGCVGSATISVNVNPLPFIGIKGSTLCANTTITLSASGGTAYSWSGPQSFTSNNATVNIPNSTTDMAGDYTVTVTDVNNCSRSAVTNVSINPVPQATIGSNGPICAGKTLSLTVQALNAVLYYWHGPLDWLSVEQNPSIVGLQPGASGVYSVHVHDQIGCTGTATLDVLVRNLPQLSITSNKYNGCIPLCISLGQQSSSQIVSGAWQFGEGGDSYGLTASYCYNKAGHYVITNNYTDNFGCANASTLAVDAWPIPIADFNISPEKPVINENVDFTDATFNANAAAWTWYFSDENNKIYTGKDAGRIFTDAGEYAAVLIVTSDHGCKDTIVKPVLVAEGFGLYVPDAFTPNGDGVNDIFTAKGIGISKFTMNIFDRWGEMLYSTNSIENGWDGKFHGRGDDIVKQDVYVWKIKITDMQGKVHELAGTVTVLR